MKIKLIISVAICVLLSVTIFFSIFALANGNLDVVQSGANKAFGILVKENSDLILKDNKSKTYSILFKDNLASLNFSNGVSSNGFDVYIKLASKPFIDAGLDVLKLSSDFVVTDDSIITGIKLEKSITANSLQEYFEILSRQNRDLMGYHSEMDHFNINLLNGNVFEFAKDLKVNTINNEKQGMDLVLALNPEEFEKSGADLNKIEGFELKEVMSGGHNGKMEEKLIKSFDLK